MLFLPCCRLCRRIHVLTPNVAADRLAVETEHPHIVANRQPVSELFDLLDGDEHAVARAVIGESSAATGRRYRPAKPVIRLIIEVDDARRRSDRRSAPAQIARTGRRHVAETAETANRPLTSRMSGGPRCHGWFARRRLALGGLCTRSRCPAEAAFNLDEDAQPRVGADRSAGRPR